MTKLNTRQKWISSGYSIFANDGPECLQVERLAKILGLNKSGFYHYFGDHEFFIELLLNQHQSNAIEVAAAFTNANKFDPDFFSILLMHKQAILFHMQLVRNRHIGRYFDFYRSVNALVDPKIIRLFSEFVGLQNNVELVAAYYEQSRDMFYSRITEKNLNEPFLRSLVGEVKQVAQNFLQQQTFIDKTS